MKVLNENSANKKERRAYIGISKIDQIGLVTN